MTNKALRAYLTVEQVSARFSVSEPHLRRMLATRSFEGLVSVLNVGKTGTRAYWRFAPDITQENVDRAVLVNRMRELAAAVGGDRSVELPAQTAEEHTTARATERYTAMMTEIARVRRLVEALFYEINPRAFDAYQNNHG